MSDKKNQDSKPFASDSQIIVTDTDLKSYAARLNVLLTEPHTEARLNELERQTLESLVGYLVQEYGTDKDTIWTMVTSTFDVCNKDELTGRSYNDIVQYLVNLNLKYAIN